MKNPKCAHCEEEVEPWDRAPNYGSAFHDDCMLRCITGSYDHITRGPHKVGTCLPDDPELTVRQAATKAAQAFRALSPEGRMAVFTNEMVSCPVQKQ